MRFFLLRLNLLASNEAMHASNSNSKGLTGNHDKRLSPTTGMVLSSKIYARKQDRPFALSGLCLFVCSIRMPDEIWGMDLLHEEKRVVLLEGVAMVFKLP